MDYIGRLIKRFGMLSPCKADILAAYKIFCETFSWGSKAIVCGNGGSAADSGHLVAELMKGNHSSRPLPEEDMSRLLAYHGEESLMIALNLQVAFPAVSLCSNIEILTAYANDVSADMVFAQQVYGYAKPGDVFVGFSTSGNSKTVVYAAVVAKQLGIKTIGFSGASGGKLAEICDVCIRPPAVFPEEAQELHAPIYHTICAMLEQEFFGGD